MSEDGITLEEILDALEELRPLELAVLHETLTSRIMPDTEAERLAARERADWLLGGGDEGDM